jgi:hypothetical protein
MLVKCPSCNAGFSLDVALALDAGRSALLTALQMPAPIGMLLAQYLGMFRAAGRALSFDRTDRLLRELQPMFDKAVVTRNGLTRPCPLALWQQGIEKIIEHRNADKLQLPLKTHGYLLEIVFALAESAGAKQEKVQETQRRTGARDDSADKRMQRTLLISGVCGEMELGLITREEAEQKLRDAGINPEVLRS